MAKLTRILSGDLGQWAQQIQRGILNASTSASLEDSWSKTEGDSRCTVMVFERYSWSGNNRVSMTVTLFQNGNGPIHLCAITAGGSQALFFKLNTIGEESFLDTLRALL